MPFSHRTPLASLLLTLSFSVSFGVLGAGCGSRPDAADSTLVPSASVVFQSSTPAVSASTSVRATPSGSASVRPRRHGPSIKQVASDLQKRCTPKKTGDSNMEMKQQEGEMLDCMRKKLNADLDEVLLPLKKTDSPRFKALMAEQAVWNRALEPSCNIEEELAWLDIDDGSRSDGTARGYAYMGCLDVALTERVLYARSMSAADAGSLAKHVKEVQKRGAETKANLLDKKTRAATWVNTPPAPSEYGVPADWKAFIAGVEKIEKNTSDLARSTCTNWPELNKALGGDATCLKQAELYYYLQGNSPPDNEVK